MKQYVAPDVKRDIFEKVTPEGLRGRIAQQIRDAILNGKLHEGERLVERKLAADLGTSLTAVREAMIELEAQGFLTKTPNSATHVTKLAWADVEKIFAVRRVLEGFAVEQACQQVAAAEVDVLEGIYFEMLDCARAGDSTGFNRADMGFHLALWQAAGNTFLEMALRRALLPYFAFGAIRLRAHQSMDLLRDANLHLPIVEALRAGDAEAGRRAFEAGVQEWYSGSHPELKAGNTATTTM